MHDILNQGRLRVCTPTVYFSNGAPSLCYSATEAHILQYSATSEHLCVPLNAAIRSEARDTVAAPCDNDSSFYRNPLGRMCGVRNAGPEFLRATD